SGTTTNGRAEILLPTLAISTVKVRARASDRAGNEGTSSVSTMSIVAATLAVTDATRIVDFYNGLGLLQGGILHAEQLLDVDKSPGTAVGGDPVLAYNSDRVSVKPIIAAEVQTDNSSALPSTVSVRLTFNGTAQA